MIYGTKLKSLRIENNKTEKEIANILKIERGVYSLYETEKVTIPLKHLITLSDYFKVSLDYLFNFSSTKNYHNSTYFVDKDLAGKKLKQFRKDNKITQEQLAKILNTDRSVLANYERGRTLIATPFLYDICYNYKISADYLLGKIDKPFKIETSNLKYSKENER